MNKHLLTSLLSFSLLSISANEVPQSRLTEATVLQMLQTSNETLRKEFLGELNNFKTQVPQAITKAELLEELEKNNESMRTELKSGLNNFKRASEETTNASVKQALLELREDLKKYQEGIDERLLGVQKKKSYLWRVYGPRIIKLRNRSLGIAFFGGALLGLYEYKRHEIRKGVSEFGKEYGLPFGNHNEPVKSTEPESVASPSLKDRVTALKETANGIMHPPALEEKNPIETAPSLVAEVNQVPSNIGE